MEQYRPMESYYSTQYHLMKSIFYTLSFVLIAFSMKGQTTDPQSPDTDHIQEEMSQGFEQLFEMLDSNTFNLCLRI